MRPLLPACLAACLGTAGTAQESLILSGPEGTLPVPVSEITVLETEGDALWVRLADAWVQPFGEFTAQNVTLQIEVSLCDAVLSAPRINEPLSSPVFPLTDDPAAMLWIRAVLDGAMECDARP